MKKQVLLFILALLPVVASAFTGEAIIDGIKYFVVTKAQTAEVVANDYSGNIIIPSSIEYEGTICFVSSIREKAFYGCNYLTDVTIGNKITNIGSNAFYGCINLTRVIIEDIGKWCNINFADSWSNPLSYANHLYDKGNTEIKNLIIPNTVTSIGIGAFSDCSGIVSIDIPNSVTNISASAFSGCSGLVSVIIPNSVITIENYAFSGCRNLVSVIIPNSVITINDYAFWGCSNMISVKIPYSVTSIGNIATKSRMKRIWAPLP